MKRTARAGHSSLQRTGESVGGIFPSLRWRWECLVDAWDIWKCEQFGGKKRVVVVGWGWWWWWGWWLWWSWGVDVGGGGGNMARNICSHLSSRPCLSCLS